MFMVINGWPWAAAMSAVLRWHRPFGGMSWPHILLGALQGSLCVVNGLHCKSLGLVCEAGLLPRLHTSNS